MHFSPGFMIEKFYINFVQVYVLVTCRACLGRAWAEKAALSGWSRWDLKSHRLWLRPWTQIQADHSHSLPCICPMPLHYVESILCQHLIAKSGKTCSRIAAASIVVQSRWVRIYLDRLLSRSSRCWADDEVCFAAHCSLLVSLATPSDWGVWRARLAPSLLHVLYTSTNVNMQFGKLEQHTYGLWPRYENAQYNISRLCP